MILGQSLLKLLNFLNKLKSFDLVNDVVRLDRIVSSQTAELIFNWLLFALFLLYNSVNWLLVLLTGLIFLLSPAILF